MITWIHRGKEESIDDLIQILIQALADIPKDPILY